MTPIGGYFELELNKGSNHYHDTPYVLKSGRSALGHILNYIKPKVVYIPYYTCDALLEPFKNTNVPFLFYELNNFLEPKTTIELKEGEYYLYINYSDLKRNTVNSLSELYRDRLIVDCTQAFFMKGNGVSWYFNSCRKFFGVPDGSYLYCPDGIELPMVNDRNENYVTDHLLKRFNGHVREGYNCFQENELLAGMNISGISKLSEYLLSQINYNAIISARRTNYEYLHSQFEDFNKCEAAMNVDKVPMYYPLLLSETINKQYFYDIGIFIPTFWRDTHSRGFAGFEFEKELSDKMLVLPIDQRYTLEDMTLLCTSLKRIL